MKIRKLLAGVIALAMTVTGLPQAVVAEAGDTGTYEDYSYSELSDGTLSITKYSGSEAEVVIPAEIEGKAVSEIGSYAFESCSSLTAIGIPDSVTSIGACAFLSCSSLASVKMSDNVTYIGVNAFGGTPLLSEQTAPVKYVGNWVVACDHSAENIEIKEETVGIASNVFYISSYELWTPASHIKSISIPASLLYISDCVPPPAGGIGGRGAEPDTWFTGCKRLQSINVSSENAAFSSVDGVLFDKAQTTLIHCPADKPETSLEIPDSVTDISEGAFAGCTNLTSLNIPDGVTNIKYGTFWGCENLETIIIPDSVTSIGHYAFSLCSSLSGIDIPDGVTKIGVSTFYGCESLTSIEIPDSVTEIGMSAFEDCTSLTSIKIPDSVTYIGDWAFDGHSDDLTIYGYTGSYAESYAKAFSIPFSPIGFVLSGEEETGIKIVADEGAVPDDAELKVTELENDDKTPSIIFDITLTDENGVTVQPENPVTVKVPIPEDWDTKDVKVYRVENDGTHTDMNAYILGGYIIFKTDHFSQYMITTKKPIASGDVNANGKVDDLDVIDLARYLAGWDVEIDMDAANVNGDENVDDLDVIMLARRLAGWNV